MIILGFDDIENELLKQKNRFEDNIIILNTTDFVNKQDNDVNKYPLNFLQVVKSEYKAGNFIFIKYDKDVPSFLTAIKLPYKILITKELQENGNLPAINNVEVLEDISEILTILKNYDWYIEEKNETSDVSLIPNEHKVLTLQDLIDDDENVTSLDIQDVQALQNKLKMGILLQAKSMLNRVLKLTNILDKLYDELLVRIENNISTTDTASLMYTTDYISKALSETNQFIVSLVNNEKIYNFFIFDNSTVINNNNVPLDLDKREKIRKAAEIILNNYEKISDGDYSNVINPNSVLNDEEKKKDNEHI